MEPIVITDTPRRTVRILLALEEVVLTESRFAAGEVGTEPHVHRLHADCFYVLDGTLTLPLRNGDRELGPGTFALIPPNVVHAFRNDGPGEVRYLNLHTPGCGFDRYLLGLYEPAGPAPFDQHLPPEDGGLDPGGVVLVLGPGEGEHVGITTIKAALPELSVLEFETAPGGGAALHLHRGQSDAFYMLEGELQLDVGEETVTAVPGSFVVSPPGLVHGFRNTSTMPARALNLHAPGGFAEYLRELHVLRAAGGEPDTAFFERHDVFDPE